MPDQTFAVPNGWKMTTLGEVVSLAQGVAINAKTDYILCDKNEGLPLLKINNLLNSTVDMYANPKFVTSKAILHKDDVIFTRTGQVGWVFTGKVGILHNNSFKVIPSNNIDGKYLYWFLKQKSVFEYAQRVASGSAQPDLNHSAFRTIEINLPTFPEQQAIAAILFSLDNKIELLREQNKILEATAQALFKEWFVKFNFPGSTGKMIDSELGEIPEGWTSGVLNDYIGELESGKRPKGGVGQLKSGIPSVGAESINGITQFDFSKTKYISEEFFSKMNTGKVKNYDILVYKDGGTPGTFLPRFTMTGEGFPFTKFAINEHVFRVQTKNETQRFFLYMWLNSFYCKRELQNIGGKAAIPGINSTDFRNISLLHPSEQVLMSYHLAVSPIFKKILINNSQIRILASLRDALLPKLMKGELRLSGFNN